MDDVLALLHEVCFWVFFWKGYQEVRDHLVAKELKIEVK